MKRVLVRWIGLAVAGAACFAYLKIGGGSDYAIYMCTMVFMYAGLASSLDLLIGFTGRISFAHAAFFGLGAYATSLVMLHWHFSFPEGALFAVLASGAIAFLVGLVTIRVSGLYFALAMTALSLVFVSVIELPELTSLTGGATGFTGIPVVSYLSGEDTFYVVFLILLVLILAIKVAIGNSRLGTRMIALRDDEELARTLGLKTNFYKVFAFVLASSFAGLSGAFFALFFQSLAPGDFDIWASFSLVVWVLVGGVGSVLGPVIGVALLWTVPQQLEFNPNANLIIYGAVLILIVSFQRGGIFGAISRSWEYVTRRRLEMATPEQPQASGGQ